MDLDGNWRNGNMAKKVYMVNNNSEYSSTLAVVQIEEDSFDAVYAFICALNSESKDVREPSITISEYKKDTKTNVFGQIKEKLDEWDDKKDWTFIDGYYYLKYQMD
jgi:hypothetical protein